MVKAELNYNPYLHKTLIRFNGREPRVNSVVEKYRDIPLQTWIKDVPRIFHDEMNGYDFELEFSGTKLDYEGVKDSFRRAGVGEESVRISYKNELDGRSQKLESIQALMKWLDDNRNERFSFEDFCEEEQVLSDGIYTVICLGTGKPNFSFPDNADNLSVEIISSADELDNTDLNNTPILIDVTISSISKLQLILRSLLGRNEVGKDQLFFSIDQRLDQDKTVRILNDLGIKEPQLVASDDLSNIYNYLEVYPVSDYIYGVLKNLRTRAEEVRQSLDNDMQVNASINKKTYEKIDEIENRIEKLKESLNLFVNRDNINVPDSWMDYGQELFDFIRNWKRRKTKITNDEEAIKGAIEFDYALHRKYSEFQKNIKEAALKNCMDIDRNYKEWYQCAEVDKGYIPKKVALNIRPFPEIPELTEAFLSARIEKQIEDRDNLLGKFLKVGLDRNDTTSIEVAYYYQDWREHAAERIRPLFEEVIDICYDAILEYEKNLAECYQKHLEELIKVQKQAKEETALQLSEEDKRIQNDEEWLIVFCDQLKAIERG